MNDRDELFRQFVTQSSAGLLRLAFLLCGDHALAEDLVQTALVRTYARWHRIDTSPQAYVRRVLVTVAVDEGRRAHRRREQIVDELPEPSGVDDGFGDVIERDRLRLALLDLPPRQRAAVVLRHWLDLDPASAAALLGCSPETVRSQAMRGLAKLRDACEVRVATEGDPDA